MAHMVPDLTLDAGRGCCSTFKRGSRVVFDDEDNSFRRDTCTCRLYCCSGGDRDEEINAVAWRTLGLALQENHHVTLERAFEALRISPDSTKGALEPEVYERIVEWAKAQHLPELSVAPAPLAMPHSSSFNIHLRSFDGKTVDLRVQSGDGSLEEFDPDRIARYLQRVLSDRQPSEEQIESLASSAVEDILQSDHKVITPDEIRAVVHSKMSEI
jgi:hypothetical protein